MPTAAGAHIAASRLKVAGRLSMQQNRPSRPIEGSVFIGCQGLTPWTRAQPDLRRSR